MTVSLAKCALGFALLGGAALLSVPAIAADFSEEGNFGGTYDYIGPGASYGAPLNAAPELIVVPPPLDDGGFAPDAGAIFIAPDGTLAVGAE